MQKVFRIGLLTSLSLLIAVSAVAQQAAPPALTLRDIHASSKFSQKSFEGGRWADQGPIVTYIVADGDITHLISYNLETDQRTRLLDGRKLRAEDTGRPVRIEEYQYSADGEQVLLYTDSEKVWRDNTKGFYYLYDLARETLTPLSDRARGFQMFAKLSPDGRHAAFVRDRNLFLVDLKTRKETQLTFDGAEGSIINGTSDWVYEEEFGLQDGWAWSPDGRYIAFFQLDETATREFQMADLRGQYPELVRFRYPKAGEANSEIRVGVIDVASQQTRFFDTDTWHEGGDRHEYIPQMGWTPALDGTHYVWMFRMNRDQNALDLLYGDPATGAVRTILEERSDTWIDVETMDDADVGAITYLLDREHFVWISERDGYRHLYLYRNDGTFVRQVTEGDWDVTDFEGVDEDAGIVYFTATEVSPLQRHLYRTPLMDEIGKDGGRGPMRLTKLAGWHSVEMSRDRQYYLDTYSNITTPSVVTLQRADGELLKVLEDNQALVERLAAYDLPAPEFVTVPGADGTVLNGWVIKPRAFDASKAYPLFMFVYGGPGSEKIKDGWNGQQHLWHTYLAEELDIVVVGFENRGTGGRGKAFKSAPYRQLGLLEAQDQIAVAKHFGRQPWIDAERIGIWGWSYGGFMTLMAMLTGDGPETFKVGAAVAPVTDWRLYDTIYTERYMSTPQENPEGYDLASPLHYADRLRDDQHLLLVHGDFDDNVHFQNAIQMVDALQEAGRQFDFMVYPGRDHSIYGGLTRLHLYRLITGFVREHL